MVKLLAELWHFGAGAYWLTRRSTARAEHPRELNNAAYNNCCLKLFLAIRH